MKKIISLLLSILLLAFSFVPSSGAYQSEREYFEDGSYIIISDEFIGNDYEGEDDNHISGDGQGFPENGESGIGRILKTVVEIIKKIIAFLKNNKTVTETKYVSYYSSEGKLLWMATLTAGFTYNGKSAVCDSAKAGCNIYDSDWRLVSKDCAKNENTATANFTVKQHKLAVPLKTIEKSLTITCDKDGNIK